MKEMVGGCCVCSDERGWPDNPLVYCDGNGCTVAVHQACYGIVTVPTGPWFCRKCESPDKQTRVRCELCPSRAGALKRSDGGGWAHVVCALYIPEVRFGNVTSMEPILLQHIPMERFSKACYICQEMGKVSKSVAGACMQCNKSGCKQQFHVTCAQGLGLLCEEAGNYLDNVKYCGYCRHHYGKLTAGKKSTAHPSAGGSAKGSSQVIKLPSSSASYSSTSEGPTGAPSSKQSPQNKSGGALPKMPPNQGKGSDKSSHKKSPSPAETQRKSSGSNSSTSSEPIPSTSTVVIPAVSPIPSTSQGRANPTQSPSNKLPPNQQDAIVVLNGIRINPGTSSSIAVSTAAPAPSHQQTSQKFTNSNFTETVITNSDSVFGIGPEVKQTKKRKAVTQAAANSGNPYPPGMSTITSAQMKTESTLVTSTITKPSSSTPQHSGGGLNIQMETNLSAALYNAPPTPSTSYSTPSPIAGPSQAQTQTITAPEKSASRLPSPAPPNIQIPNPNIMPISSRNASPNTLAQNLSQKYPGTPQRADELPASLVVSVPLPQSSQGIQLSGHQASTSSEPTFVQPASPMPSASSWGLKVAYEPQINSQLTQDMAEDTRRPRSESMEQNIKVPLPPGPITNETDSPMLPAVNMRRKRSAMATATVTQGTMAAPSTSGAAHMSTIGTVQQGPPIKRSTQPAPSPTIPLQEIRDSPPGSPDPSEAHHSLKMIKPNLDKLGRAPHMLGNELNPESAAAARLSEQLSAELAAHSVFRAPSPLVPPPLINRATAAGRNLAGAAPMGLGGGAQSLDQLLERQWEQGSQFLMEQAQHFDIASLLSCLHQLRTENVRLEQHVTSLVQRRDHLLAVNARLAIPLNSGNIPTDVGRASGVGGSSMRQPPAVRVDGGMERNQQMVIRELQPKSS